MSNLSIDQALENIAEAEKALKLAIAWNLSIGSSVFWEVNGMRQDGVVTKLGPHRIRVRNNRTGRDYWLHAYRLTARWGGGIGS